MAVAEKISKRNSIPIIYVRGSHYDVGFEVGRTFRFMIQSYVSLHGPLNETYLPLYETAEGKKSYDLTLEAMMKNFPQYVEEIKGTAEGADVPFHKLFLLHMDEILPGSVNKTSNSSNGCTTICCNLPGQETLAHNEDALAETLNHFYFVSAHIISQQPEGRWKVKEEKFTSLCYAGTLPGFTMSYNSHGLLFSVNLIRAKNLQAGKTPRTFITRALLAAKNLCQVQDILKDCGTGIGDAVSINMIFLKEEGIKIFFNAEVAPAEPPLTHSQIHTIKAKPGEHISHCNRLLRLNAPEGPGYLIESSEHRHKAIDHFPAPKSSSDVLKILGDESDKEFPLYNKAGFVRTIATGVFHLGKMTWSIFTDNPKTNDPIVELPIII